MEIWKPVVDFEGFYSVSNYGNVRREEHKGSNGHTYCQRPLVLLPGWGKLREYRFVNLSKNGKITRCCVHRLVAMAFIEKPDGCNVVNHLDCNPSNNNVSNLEWTTYKGNMQYASSLGHMKGSPENIAKAQEKSKVPVIAIDKDGNRFYFSSQAEAGKKLGVNSSHIAFACRKEYAYKRLNGYEFEYADEGRKKNAIPKRTAKTREECNELTRQRMIGNKYGLGRKPSEKCIQRIKEIHSIPVVQFDLNGNKIAEFPSVAEAKRITGIFHIDLASKGNRKTAGGYIWRRKDELEKIHEEMASCC